jgi:hypothetical protein
MAPRPEHRVPFVYGVLKLDAIASSHITTPHMHGHSAAPLLPQLPLLQQATVRPKRVAYHLLPILHLPLQANFLLAKQGRRSLAAHPSVRGKSAPFTSPITSSKRAIALITELMSPQFSICLLQKCRS